MNNDQNQSRGGPKGSLLHHRKFYVWIRMNHKVYIIKQNK